MIHNLKMLCPRGHVFAAISWNDAHHTQDEVAEHLARGAHLVARGGPIICAVCGSVDFHVEDVVTEYRSMREAMPALTEIAVNEMIERDQLARTDDRN